MQFDCPLVYFEPRPLAASPPHGHQLKHCEPRGRDERELITKQLKTEVEYVLATALSEQEALCEEVVARERAHWEGESEAIRKDLEVAHSLSRRLYDTHVSVILGLRLAIEAEYSFPPASYQQADDPQSALMAQVEKQREELVAVRQSIWEREWMLQQSKAEVERSAGRLVEELALAKTDLVLANQQKHEAQQAKSRLQVLVSQLQGNSSGVEDGREGKAQAIVKKTKDLVEKHKRGLPAGSKEMSKGMPLAMSMGSGSLGSLNMSMGSPDEVGGKKAAATLGEEEVERLRAKVEDIAAMLSINWARWNPAEGEMSPELARQWVAWGKGGGGESEGGPKSAKGKGGAKGVESELRATVSTLRREKLALESKLKQTEARASAATPRVAGPHPGGMSMTMMMNNTSPAASSLADSGRPASGRASNGGRSSRRESMVSPPPQEWEGKSVGHYLGDDEPSVDGTPVAASSLSMPGRGRASRSSTGMPLSSGRRGSSSGRAGGGAPMVWTSAAATEAEGLGSSRQANTPYSTASTQIARGDSTSLSTPGSSRALKALSPRALKAVSAQRQSLAMSSFQFGQEPPRHAYFAETSPRQTSPAVVNFGGDLLDSFGGGATPRQIPTFGGGVKKERPKAMPQSARMRSSSPQSRGEGVFTLDSSSLSHLPERLSSYRTTRPKSAQVPREGGGVRAASPP